MIDGKHLEPAAGLRLGSIAGRIDGGGKRDGLAEFAAVYFAAFEVVDQISDESFHAVTLLAVDFYLRRTIAACFLDE